jgi:hypothetical protein
MTRILTNLLLGAEPVLNRVTVFSSALLIELIGTPANFVKRNGRDC